MLPISTAWSGPVAGSVARTFGNDLRVATESVNGAGSVTYVYEGDSLVDLVDPASGPDLDLLRNPTGGFGAGLLTGTVQDAISTTETPSALAATENSNPLYSLDVSDRDALGRVETKVEAIGAGPSTTTVYTYDPARRLDTVSVNGTLVADYAYDGNGNRTHEREDLGGGAIAAYDAQDRLTSHAGTSYAYSEAGDLETETDAGGTTAYDFDALGNLRSVVFPDGKQLEYVIDGQSRRVGKKVCAAPCTGGATPQLQQGFLYADQLRIVAELDGSNNVVSRFVYATRPNVPDFLVKNGVTYRILSDQVGSVRLVVDATTGAIAQRIDYDAFGNVLADTNPGFQPFGFAGGLRDLDTGLVRFGARDYDPRVGRWTTKDPIRFEGGDANLYGYLLADPVNAIDPTGLAPPGSSGLAGEITLFDLANFAAGMGTVVSFGLTDRINDLTGASYLIDTCSTAFRGGQLVGAANLVGLGVAAGARAAVTTTIRRRAATGADGAVSEIAKTTSNLTGRTIEVVHRVVREGEVVHSHAKYRRFLPF